MNNKITQVVLVAALLVQSAQVFAQDFSPSDTARVSAGTYSAAPETNGAAANARMSKNGRFIVFESTATNLVSSHTVSGGIKHCYVYDRQADQIEIVSLTDAGNPIESNCNTPSVSNDGRYVAFASKARVEFTVPVGPGDQYHVNQEYDGATAALSGSSIWVRDRFANQTMLISQVTLPVKRQAIDPTTFLPKTATDAVTGNKVPVLETVTKRIAAAITGTPPLPANSFNPRISADGQYIVYDTDATNLVLATNTEIVYSSLIPGAAGPPVTNDYNVVTGYVHHYDPISTITTYYDTIFFIPIRPYVDGNLARDIYVRDGSTLTNTLVSLSCKFHEPNKCQVQGTSDATDPVISDDGETVVFTSATKFLDLDFNGTSDVFLVERTGVYGEVSKLVRISNNTSRIVAGNGASSKPSLSANGRFLAFQSDATNLVTNDTNGKTDVFIFDRQFNRTILCSTPTSGTANQNSTTPDISGAGEYVVFQSTATSFGVSSGVDNIYMGTIAKGVDGDAVSCSVGLISKGSGSGSTLAATVANVGIIPRSTIRNGALVRTRSATVSYQTAATNICSESDSNGVTDVFQTPICTEAERTTDTDGDGTSNCFDQCASDPIAVESDDSDADGVADCEDGCSSDPQKIGAGFCGCGVADTDTDSDNSPDCNDACDNDPNKTAAGTCGCGIPDTDSDGDGTADCKETNSPDPSTTPAATPTPTATATPTFNLVSYKPPAPTVKKVAALTVDIKFSTSAVTDPSAVSSFDLTGRKLSASSNKIRARVGFRKKSFLGGRLKLPSSGRWSFSVRYNGSGTTQSLSSNESRAITVN